MNVDQSETLESNIPRRGRPRKHFDTSPPKKKARLTLSLSGIRKPKPRAVKFVLPSVPATVQSLAKVTNQSNEIVKSFPVVTTKDSSPITTFLLAPTDGKTGTLAPPPPASKPESVPMAMVQHVGSGATSMKQLPVAVTSNILPRVQVSSSSSSTGSTPKLLLITTASNSSSVSIPTASINQNFCKSILPMKLSNNTSSSNTMVATNHSKQVLYKIPSSQSSGMVLLSTTAPTQSGVAPKKYLLIPSSTTAKRQSRATMILNSVDPNSDKPIIAITPRIQPPSNAESDTPKMPTTTVPMLSSSLDTTSKKLTRQSVNTSKRVNTSRRRGSVLGANSTISSIPSGIFKTVACTTDSRGICSTPASVQASQTQSNVKLSPVGSFVTPSPPITTPVRSAFNQDASLNITMPIVPQAPFKTNHLTQSPNCSIAPVNKSKLLQTSQSQLNAAGASTQCAKRSRPLPGQRAKKTISKMANKERTTSFITVPSSLPFSAIQLKPNSSTATSSVPGLSWVVAPNTAHQEMPSLDSEKVPNHRNIPPTRYESMPKLIVMNGVSNSSVSTPQSANSQTCNNGCQTGMFSTSHYSECSLKKRPVYASPPTLTIAPTFSTPDTAASISDKSQHPSELMIIKEREEFIDDSLEISNLEDLSPPKLQREDGPDLNGHFNFDVSSPTQSSSLDYLTSVKFTPKTEPGSNNESVSAIRKPHQSFYGIKSMSENDNFPAFSSLSAMNSNKWSEFISRLDKNRKLSFGQLFNHFKLLADKKKNKKQSNHSAIMFQVAHSIHCCVVLSPTDVKGSVDLKDMPFCVEQSLKCSVKCRQAFMKKFFAEKAISVLNQQFNLSTLKSTDSVDEQSARYCRSKGPTLTDPATANETLCFPSVVTPELLNIKTETPDYKEYPSADQLESLPNSCFTKKTTENLTSEAFTQKFAPDIDETFSSFSTPSDFRCLTQSKCLAQSRCSTQSRCSMQSRCSLQSSQSFYSNYLTPNEPSTSRNPFFHSEFPKGCNNSNSCINSCTKAKNNERFCFCNVQCKKSPSSLSSFPHKIKDSCNSKNELSSVLNVSSSSNKPQVLAGKLRYKIVPKGHISLLGKNNNPEIKSNCMQSPNPQARIPVQSYIINSDQSSLNPLQTVSSILPCSKEVHKDETKNPTGSNLNKKQNHKRPSLKADGENPNPTKKRRTSKIKESPSKKETTKESCSKSSHSTKISLPPLVERPLSVRDPKHLYDEPTTVDRVVMLTPEGKPILTDTDLQITFDDSLGLLSSPKKKGTLTKSPVKLSGKKSSSILKNSLPSCSKGKVQSKHSKSSSENKLSRPPTLKLLLRELETKCKYKYLSSSESEPGSIKPNDSVCHKESSVSKKSKKENIEQITNNIASGFPAFGPGNPRCTMNLYKYFVSTRIKNRAKKNGSHEIDTPLTLYINWKTISRQPFNKHRITNHTLNVMAIKKARQFSNYKKCKGRSKMCKPVKNKPLFMKRRKALLRNQRRRIKSKANNKSIKKTNKKPSKFVQPWTKKKKTQITKIPSTKKKAPVVSNLSHLTKMEAESIIMKGENSPKLDSIIKKKKSKSLVNNKEAKQNEMLKSAQKKIKSSKPINKKSAIKKGSSLPNTPRSKKVLLETPNPSLVKVEPFYETSQAETQQAKRKKKKAVTRKVKLKQQKLLNKQDKSSELSPTPAAPLLPIKHFKNEDLTPRSKSADPITEEEEEEKPIETKSDVTVVQADNLQENNDAEIVGNLIPSYSTNVKTEVTLLQKNDLGQKTLTSSTVKKPHLNVMTQQSSEVPEMLISEKEPDIDISTQTLSLTSANNPVNENAETASQFQSSLSIKIENSGSFIYEDYAEPSLTVTDNAPMSELQFNNTQSNVCADDNQRVISNENSCSPFINATPTIRSSAFSDKFDIGLSPELARIQRLKDQLQEKQKALDLAKLHLK